MRPTPGRPMRTTLRRGFTLVELMVVGAIGVVILLLAAPSFKSMIEMQRLRSVAAQFATDVQYARSEAPAQQRSVFLAIKGNGVSPSGETMSCYVIYTCPGTASCTLCNCAADAGSRCTGGAQELRTQQLPASMGMRIRFVASDEAIAPDLASFDPVTGGLALNYPVIFGGGVPPTTKAWTELAMTGAEAPPSIRTEIALSGRPTQCSPNGRVSSLAACTQPGP